LERKICKFASRFTHIIDTDLKRLFIPSVAILLIVAVLPQCAKVVSPTGGPKDTLAPVLARSIPAINSTNFSGQKVVLYFNEYIQLKEIQQKLIVSPPLKTKPEIRLKGKSLELLFNDSLRKNTTYTVYFANAIADNNEGNAIKNFSFAFSTGSTIDSLTVSGVLTDAFTLEPVDGALVMLYGSNADSLPYKELPMHVTRTDKKGLFTLNNLKNIDYKVFALVDGNTNYLYDLETEDIAFLKDPIKKELLKTPASAKDTVAAKKVKEKGIELSLFREPPQLQLITGYARDERRKVQIFMSRKFVGGIKLQPLGEEKLKDWYVSEPDNEQDTVTYWLANDRIAALDTLKLLASYKKTDSLKRLQPQVDTLKLVFKDNEPTDRRRKRKEKDVKPTYFKVTSSISPGQVANPILPFTLTFPMPLKGTDPAKYRLLNMTDTSEIKGVKLLRDSINPRVYNLSYEWKPNTSYQFEAIPGAFTLLDGILNDTVSVKFKGADPEEYGTLIIAMKNLKKAAIVDLLNDKGKLLERKKAKAGEKVTFSYLTPAKYRLRFIDDRNANGIWDTGNYLRKTQPERVYKFTEGKEKGLINVRANWENEISFSFE